MECGARDENARSEAGIIRPSLEENGSGVIGAGCNARNVRTIKADIGQFAIAKLGQFADIALIVPERLDHADEREQHGVVSCLSDSAFGGSGIAGLCIAQNAAVQEFKWCDAANPKTHSAIKN
jgi:hypothetical protein